MSLQKPQNIQALILQVMQEQIDSIYLQAAKIDFKSKPGKLTYQFLLILLIRKTKNKPIKLT
jgi:hypothetical protein